MNDREKTFLETKLNINKKKKKLDVMEIILVSLYFLAVVSSITYFGYTILFKGNAINQLYMIVSSGLLMLAVIFLILGIYLIKGKKIVTGVGIGLTILLLLLTLTETNNIIKLPMQATMNDFTNMNITEALAWAKENKITVEQKYENSDNIEEYHIISQNIKIGTLVKNIDIIEFTVSSGPNYEKEVILPSMIGWDIDDAITTIKNNFLNNVEINYVANLEVAKDLITAQSVKGQMRRSTKLVITVSLGNPDVLVAVAIPNLTNKTLFDATLWLKRNGIKYTLLYEFSDTIKRDNVISQSIKEKTLVDPKVDTVILTISKGKKIIVPDLMKMSIDDITTWIIDNNLKISYADRFDKTILVGGIIDVNYKEGAEIEEGTTIALVISKGQLKMKSFNSIGEFRTWAGEFGVNYLEVSEYNTSVGKGSIIRFSHQVNDILGPTDTVTVYLSNGSPITIPNFIGKTKASIISTCNSLGLYCTYYSSAYSSYAKDVALSQNKRAGSEVISGTNVSIGLSKGVALTYTVYFSDSQLTLGNADETINTLRAWLNTSCPGVTFNFTKHISSTYENSGFIHESSPIKDGSRVTQGNTYNIWITTN